MTDIIRRYWREIILGLGMWCAYILLQSKSIIGGDGGDFAAASWTVGVPHAPGYALYTIMGAVVSHILPIYTVAWRVGLISSFFGALSLVLFYRLVYIFSGKKSTSFALSILLGFTYPFFLYSEVVEVFSLAVFFVLALFYASILIYDKPTSQKLIFFVFILGLSLTHHHIILFLFPAIAFIFYKIRKSLRKMVNIRFLGLSLLAFLAGLSPLIYFPIASGRYPLVDWEHPVNLANFTNLMFRTAYGTFKAGAFIVDDPIARLYSTLSSFRLLWIDISFLGVAGFLTGFAILYFKKRKYFWPAMIGFLSYLFFLFYASFPLVNDFSLGTYERFTLFLYLFVFMFIGVALGWLYDMMQKRIYKINRINQLFVNVFWAFILSILIFLMLSKNVSLIYALRDDFTAENVGRDILRSADPHSLIILVYDTSLFNTYYVYAADPVYKNEDKIPIHFSKLFLPYYQETLKHNYPSLYVPDNSVSSDDLVIKFIEENAKSRNVYLNFYIPSRADELVPMGMVYQFVSDDNKKVNIDDVIRFNNNFWEKTEGYNRNDLKFHNLYLTEVLNIYSTALQNYAFYLLNHGKAETAYKEIEKAKTMAPDDNDLIFLEGYALELMGECKKAEEVFIKLTDLVPNNTKVWNQLATLARDCFHDKDKGSRYEKEFQKLKDKSLNLHSL